MVTLCTQLVALHEVRERPSFANAQANPAAHVQQSLLSAPGQHNAHAAAASSTSSKCVCLCSFPYFTECILFLHFECDFSPFRIRILTHSHPCSCLTLTTSIVQSAWHIELSFPVPATGHGAWSAGVLHWPMDLPWQGHLSRMCSAVWLSRLKGLASFW